MSDLKFSHMEMKQKVEELRIRRSKHDCVIMKQTEEGRRKNLSFQIEL